MYRLFNPVKRNNSPYTLGVYIESSHPVLISVDVPFERSEKINYQGYAPMAKIVSLELYWAINMLTSPADTLHICFESK